MIITLDPGLSLSGGGTGYAVFDSSEVRDMPQKWGVIKATTKNKDSWIDRSTDIIEQLDFMFCAEKMPDGMVAKQAIGCKVFIELPTFFQTSKGHSAAAGKAGDDSDLVKLAVHCGRLYELFDSSAFDVNYVRVNAWKGSLSKEAVSTRIAKRLNLNQTAIKYFGDHATDAVGIGIWVKGVFQPNA